MTTGGLALIALLTMTAGFTSAEEPHRVTLDDAVSSARARYPSLEAARARAAAARAGVGVARTAYRPRVDLVLQENRATRNNISGLVFPQAVLPQISGPVLPKESSAMRWNSAAGVLLSWEPFDLGLRGARVNQARSEAAQAERAADVTELDVAFGAADAFLGAVAAHEAVRSARANVERMEVFFRSVRTLAANQLRAGADSSRAEAELARARTQLIGAEQAAEVSRAVLAEATGEPGAAVVPDPGPLLSRPSDPRLPDADPAAAPQVRAQAAVVALARARRQAVERAGKPRFLLQAAASDRGSGFGADGRSDTSGTGGLLPDTANLAVGAQVTYGFSDAAEARARARVERENQAAEEARHRQALQSVRLAMAQAAAAVRSAERIADNTPIQLRAAREAQTQIRSRYDQGLANVSEVAEAEQLLTRAEIDDAVAHLSLWRALLAASRAAGSISPWLDRVRAEARR